MYLFIYLFFTLMIILILNVKNINKDNTEPYKIEEYKLSIEKIKNKNKSCNTLNQFNIKEFDLLNDNVIIHNKYRNELLDYKNQKLLSNLEYSKNKQNQNKLLNEKLKINIEVEKHKKILNDIKSIESDLNSLNMLFKKDINNILNDIQNNKLTKFDKEKLKNLIKSEILKTQNIYLQIKNNNDNDNKIYIIYYQKLLENKLSILQKKYRIYLKILK